MTMTLSELQSRFQTALLYLSNNNNLSTRTIPDEVLQLAQRFLNMPRMPMIHVRPEELVVYFLNLLIIASEIGIDLEEKAQEIISNLEQPAYFSA